MYNIVVEKKLNMEKIKRTTSIFFLKDKRFDEVSWLYTNSLCLVL